MRVQICPRCGRALNVVFALYEQNRRQVMLQCPKCHEQYGDDDSTVETLFLPDDDIVETRAGLEGVEARVII